VPDTTSSAGAGLVEQKGHLLLIQALAMVRDAGTSFHIVFVGDGTCDRCSKPR